MELVNGIKGQKSSNRVVFVCMIFTTFDVFDVFFHVQILCRMYDDNGNETFFTMKMRPSHVKTGNTCVFDKILSFLRNHTLD